MCGVGWGGVRHIVSEPVLSSVAGREECFLRLARERERESELFCAPLSSRFARGVGVARHRRHSFVRFLLVQAARIGQPSQADLSYLALVVVVVVLRKQNNKVPRLAPRTVGQ